MYCQFIPSEGKTLSLLVGGLVASSNAGDISHHIRSLKRMNDCRQIKSRYRRLALEHHPDQNGSNSAFIRLTEAKEEALKTCTKGGKAKTREHRRGKKHSSKKRAHRRRKAKKRQAPATSTGSSDIKHVIGSLGALCGGIEYLRRCESRPRTLRQRSDEDYERATGHKRRYKK